MALFAAVESSGLIALLGDAYGMDNVAVPAKKYAQPFNLTSIGVKCRKHLPRRRKCDKILGVRPVLARC